MVLKLYGAVISPCVRAVLLTLEALELKNVEFINLDIINGEHNTLEFSSVNPLRTVPTLQDGDTTIWDSHAISAYLVNKYGRDDGLYPKNPEKRALVDSMNHFDNGYLFAGHDAVIKSIVTSATPTAIDPELAKALERAYDLLELVLAKRTYVAGEEMTIADFHVASTISSSENTVPLKPGKHEKILKWYQKIKSLPYYAKVNSEGLRQVKEVLSKKLLN